MSRMGMLKTAISGRFGLGGQVLGGDIPTDIDVGATQPDTPMPSQRSKDKRSKVDAAGPAIFLKPEKQELKHGHDPNKISNSLVSKRHIIVQPSTRHMNYQPSTRNLTVDPSTHNIMSSPQKSMRNMGGGGGGLVQSSMRNMNSFDKKSSMRNMNAFDKKSSMRNIGKPEKKIGASPRVANINTLEANKAMETLISAPQLGSIDENHSRKTNTITKPQTTPASPSVKTNSPAINNKKASITTRTPLIMTSIDEQTTNLGTIDENSPNNQNNDKSLASTNSKNSNARSPISTSMKSTTSTNTTKSTNSTSSKNVDNINNNSNNKPLEKNSNLGNSMSSMTNKSNHSLSSRSEKTRNTDNRTKSRPKPPRKRGPSLVTPAHFNRDRPSTVLITRKEMEDILAEKQREEALEAKTMPPKSGTMSTDLWLDAANKEPQSEEFSVASGTSVEEDSPFGKSPKKVEIEDEYDINFFDITEEEEITEHTIHSGNGSFDASDLHFTDSMERRESTIKFDEYDELQTCLHINDYTNGEIARSWYKREDYDKMVDLARKTAQKAVKREKELRDELESMLRVSVSPPRAGRKNGELREETTGNDDNKSTHSGRSTGTDGKRKKPIEYRGLEAWTPEGSQKCRTLKENAIELVWNEQSRQWEEGTFDPDAIAEVYIPVSKIALKAAQERALADQKMVKRLQEQENKKKNRTGFRKSKSAIKKATKGAGIAVGHAAGKVLTETGKGAVKIGKRSGKALVATATLDPKMMKEAVKVRIHGKKKRECKHEFEVTTSKAAVERDIEELEESGSLSLHDSAASYYSQPLDRRQLMQMQRPGRPTLPTINDAVADSVSDDLSSANGGISQEFRDSSYRTGDSESNVSSPKKKSKLKLLGIVPIPGTQKKYSEDRRAEREEKRKEKMTRRPSWEASMTTGKH